MKLILKFCRVVQSQSWRKKVCPDPPLFPTHRPPEPGLGYLCPLLVKLEKKFLPPERRLIVPTGWLAGPGRWQAPFLFILLGHHQALQVGGVDHALIDLHLSEGIVDLGGGELDTEGHEGVSEGIGIDLAINLEGFEGGKDDVVVVGSSCHLGGEEGDHLGEVHGSVHLIKHCLGLSTANVLAVGTEGSDEIGGGEEAPM